MESINSFFSRVFKIIESLSCRCCFNSGIFVHYMIFANELQELGFVLGSGLTVESECDLNINILKLRACCIQQRTFS